MLFAIDHGNYGIKTASDSFIAGLTEYPTRPPLAERVIENGGKFYALTNTRIPYMRDKTRDERYFVLTLFAIARELQSRGGLPAYLGTDLAVGLPPEHFSVLKDKFAAYFKREGVRFAYNGIVTCVSVNRVFVCHAHKGPPVQVSLRNPALTHQLTPSHLGHPAYHRGAALFCFFRKGGRVFAVFANSLAQQQKISRAVLACRLTGVSRLPGRHRREARYVFRCTVYG